MSNFCGATLPLELGMHCASFSGIPWKSQKALWVPRTQIISFKIVLDPLGCTSYSWGVKKKQPTTIGDRK
tara:strand:- start:110 stop:319 length:210 start_codon:yes stop_codon:yes gene_type:complete